MHIAKQVAENKWVIWEVEKLLLKEPENFVNVPEGLVCRWILELERPRITLHSLERFLDYIEPISSKQLGFDQGRPVIDK